MRPIALVVTMLLSFSTLPSAHATEYLATGTKLMIKDGRATKKLVYVSKDPSIGVPAPGGSDDPSVVGAAFTIDATSVNGTEIARFALPAAGWTGRQTAHGARFRFVNRAAPHGSSPVRSVLIRGGLLRLEAADSGITLEAPSQTAIGVRLDAGTSRWCADFGANIVENKRGLFKARAQAGPPVGCVAPTTTTTSTTLPSVCGNGIIEPGEQCDGEAFCSATCSIDAVGCCQLGTPPGPVCAALSNVIMTDSAIYHTCVEAGGTFTLGDVPSGTEPCPSAPGGSLLKNGACQPGGPVSPTTLCCDATDCIDATVDDLGDVAFFVHDCAYTLFQDPTPVVVGTCGVPPVGSVHPGVKCVPAH